jgi:hypothetical protein
MTLALHIVGASYEGKANKHLLEATRNVPVGFHFDPRSPLAKEIEILV